VSSHSLFGRVRWNIFAFLFGFGFIAYLQQKSITIAAEPMMPQLGLSQLQIGWLEQAFVIGYTVFQIPIGALAERFGSRRTLVIMGLTAFAAMILTPLAPSIFHGAELFIALLALQLLLGIAQAATFPVSAGLFRAWFPPNRWAFVVGLQTMGLQLGAAATPPLIATLMVSFGWRNALIWTTLPALAFVAWWAWYGRNRPQQHPRVTAQELLEIGNHVEASVKPAYSARRILRVLMNRNVLLLSFAYFSMNYAFYLLGNWAFLYLVQERHLSVLESGWLAGAPPLAAAVGSGLGGLLTGLACTRFGVRWGYRLVPLLALPTAAAFLCISINVDHAYWAVATLSLCFGCVELTEGAFWGAAMTVGRSDTMIVSGFMNTGGSLAGAIGIPIVAYLSGHHQWTAAFSIGAAAVLLAALAWAAIKVEEPDGAELHVAGVTTA
jgi:MFS transporter, ACS family, glucarate transporter